MNKLQKLNRVIEILKGGAGSGERKGHPFRGNQYTGNGGGKVELKHDPSNEYHTHAQRFLNDTGASLHVLHMGNKSHFPSDKKKGVTRDVYKVTLKNKDGDSYSFNWGNSINATNKGEKPSTYDILSSISMSVSDPGSFEDYAENYNHDKYDDYGRPNKEAMREYKAVLKEHKGITRLFDQEGLDRLSEIQ